MKSGLLILSVVLAGFSMVGAKDFVNLNFDEGSLPAGPAPDFSQPTTLILPGWTARMGDHVLSEIRWNTPYQDHGSISLYSYGASVQGRYGVLLTGGAEFPSLSPIVSASISQIGMVPADAHSLLFRAFGGGGLTEVRLDGTILPLIPISGHGADPNYGVDLRGFAGREVELRLLTYAVPGGGGSTFFDSLTFSAVSIPEPSTWAFLGIGGLALLRAARRDQNAVR